MSDTVETVMGILVLSLFVVGFVFVSYHGSMWVSSHWAQWPSEQNQPPEAFSDPDPPADPRDGEDPAEEKQGQGNKDSTRTLHTIYKKGNEDQSDGVGGGRRAAHDSQTAAERMGNPPQEKADVVEKNPSCEHDDPAQCVGVDDALVDAIVRRVAEKVERGEITLLKSCNGSGVNVTSSHQHVTRFEYQCLLEDKIRWGMLENDLKKATAEEMGVRLAAAQAEARSAMEALNRTVKDQYRRATASAEERLHVVQKALKDQSKRLRAADDRLREMDRRLSLEPQAMEIRGFMKIDTFGPVLLGMGAMQIMLMLCVCLLFVRPR